MCRSGISCRPGSKGNIGYKVNSTLSVKVIVFFLAAVVIIAAIFMALDGNDRSDTVSDESSYIETDEGVVVLDENAIFITGSDFDKVFVLSFITSDRYNEYSARITLDPTISDKYVNYTWTLTETSSGYVVGKIAPKTEPFVTWFDPMYGTYLCSVVCDDGNGNSSTYEGSFTTRAYYDFDYNGVRYTFTVDYDYALYDEFTALTESEFYDRYYVEWASVSDFVKTDDNVYSLESALYKAFDTVGRGVEYSEFILAFVQLCYGTLSDSVLYGINEYYAYPTETIFRNYGDSEDLSILCAALFKEAGYNAAVAFLPGANSFTTYRTFAGIAVDAHEFENERAGTSYIYQVVGDRRYEACDADADEYLEIGLVNDGFRKYKDLDSLYDRGVIGMGSFGFYEV